MPEFDLESAEKELRVLGVEFDPEGAEEETRKLGVRDVPVVTFGAPQQRNPITGEGSNANAERVREILERRDAAFEETTGVAARDEFFNPLPDPGTTFGRLNLDFLKGLQSSFAGGLVGRATGTLDQTNELRAAPSAQEIPFLPNVDTAVGVAADIATLSPVFRGVGGALNLFSRVNQLTRGERIAVNALTNGTLAAGAEAAAGRNPAEVGLAGGITAAASAAPVIGAHVRPFFNTIRDATTRRGLVKQIPEIEARAAEILDSIPGKLNAMRAQGHPIDFDTQMVNLANDVVPGAGRRLAESYQLAAKAAEKSGGRVPDDFFTRNLEPIKRELDKVWDDAIMGGALRAPERAAAAGRAGPGRAVREVARSVATSSQRVLNKFGPEAATVSRAISRTLNDADQRFVRFAQPIKRVLDNKVPVGELEAYVAAREAGKVSRGGLRPELKELDRFLDEVAPEAMRASGIDLPLRQNYFPKIYDSSKLSSWIEKRPNREALGRLLGFEGDDLASAVERLRRGIDPEDLSFSRSLTASSGENIARSPVSALGGSIGDARVFPITYAQAKSIDMPVLSPRDTVRAYAQQLSDATAISSTFGSKFDRLIPQMVRKVDEEFGPNTARSLENIALRALGVRPDAFSTTEQVLSRTARFVNSNIVVPATMSLATISNAGQTLVNTGPLVGLPRLLRGSMKVFSNELRRAIKMNPKDDVVDAWRLHAEQVGGALSDLFSRSQLEAAGASRIASANIASRFLRFTQFTNVERMNRMTAGISGQLWGEDMVRKAASGRFGARKLARIRREFQKTGVNFDEAVARGQLTKDEMFQVGLSIANRTQFRIRPGDLPEFWSSPSAAFFRTLKTFAFNQSRFIKDEIIRDWRKAAFYGAIGVPIAGGSIQTLRRWAKGEPAIAEDETPLDWWMGSFGWTGGFGFLADSIRSTQSTGKFLEFAAGPGAVKIADATTAVGNLLLTKDGTRAAANKLVRFIPGVGQNLGGSRLPVRDKIQEGLAAIKEPITGQDKPRRGVR